MLCDVFTLSDEFRFRLCVIPGGFDEMVILIFILRTNGYGGYRAEDRYAQEV